MGTDKKPDENQLFKKLIEKSALKQDVYQSTLDSFNTFKSPFS